MECHSTVVTVIILQVQQWYCCPTGTLFLSMPTHVSVKGDMTVTQFPVDYILKLRHFNASFCRGTLGSYPSLQTDYRNQAFCCSFPQTFQETHQRYLRLVQIALRYLSFTDILPFSAFWVGLTKFGMWLYSVCDSCWVGKFVSSSLCADRQWGSCSTVTGRGMWC